MSGTQSTDGDVIEESELAAEVTDSSTARELVERACTLIEGMGPLMTSEANLALNSLRNAEQWLLRGGL